MDFYFDLILDQNISLVHANSYFVIELTFTMFQTNITSEKIQFGFGDPSDIETVQLYGSRTIRRKYIVNDFPPNRHSCLSLNSRR